MFAAKITFIACIFAIFSSCSLGYEVQPERNNADFSPVSRFQRINVKSSLARRRREVRPVQFEVDGKVFTFDLKSSQRTVENQDTLVYTAESAPRQQPNHTYTRVNLASDNSIVYQDVDKRATFTVHYNGSHILYNGVFSEGNRNYAIYDMPEVTYRPFTDQDLQYNNNLPNDIVCESAKVRQNHQKDREDEVEDEDYMALENPLQNLYPEILVVIDYHLHRHFNENISKTLKYVYNFWNAVNLMYARFNEPKVQIILKGVIIAKDETALNYIYQSRNKTDMSTISTIKILENMREYFFTDFPKDAMDLKYDSVFVMTGLDPGVIKGVGMPGLICNDRNNIGAAGDDGAYGGLLYVIHEIGHLFGLPHDGLTNDYQCQDYPDVSREIISCIMEPSGSNAKMNVVWSRKSKAALKRLSGLKKFSCLVHPSCPTRL